MFFFIEAMENQFSVERARLKLISIILKLFNASFFLSFLSLLDVQILVKGLQQTGIKYQRFFSLLFASRASL